MREAGPVASTGRCSSRSPSVAPEGRSPIRGHERRPLAYNLWVNRGTIFGGGRRKLAARDARRGRPGRSSFGVAIMIGARLIDPA
jgi:hypothetical protein